MTIIKQKDISTKYLYIQSTTVYVPSSELGLPQPLSRKQACPLPPNQRAGGGHTRLRVGGWGSPNFDDWRKSLALCLLSGYKQARKDKIKYKQNNQ
jgi:hypothetical protein